MGQNSPSYFHLSESCKFYVNSRPKIFDARMILAIFTCTTSFLDSLSFVGVGGGFSEIEVRREM